jgi:uncharacterized protein (TIGR03086 family)
MDNIDSIDLGPAAQRLAHLVARVTDDELGKPTPCPAYTVGDLVGHVGELALAFTAAADKESNEYNDQEPPPGDASRLGDDWRTRIPRDLAAMAQAWRDPEAWSGVTRIAGSESPASIVGLVAADELVVHGWDVARATGQPFRAEPELLDAAQTFLAQIANPDAPPGPDVAFGPPRQVSDGAPMLDRVLALAGRDPGWSPT